MKIVGKREGGSSHFNSKSSSLPLSCAHTLGHAQYLLVLLPLFQLLQTLLKSLAKFGHAFLPFGTKFVKFFQDGISEK